MRPRTAAEFPPGSDGKRFHVGEENFAYSGFGVRSNQQELVALCKNEGLAHMVRESLELAASQAASGIEIHL